MRVEERDLRQILERLVLIPAVVPDPAVVRTERKQGDPEILYYLGKFGVHKNGSLVFGILARGYSLNHSLHMQEAEPDQIGYLTYEQVHSLECRIMNLPENVQKEYENLWKTVSWKDEDPGKEDLRKMKQLDLFRKRNRPDEILVGFAPGKDADSIVQLPVLLEEYDEKQSRGSGRLQMEPQQNLGIHKEDQVSFQLIVTRNVLVPLCRMDFEESSSVDA